MDDFVIFKVSKLPITTYMGHYCLFSDDGLEHAPVWVLWNQVTWKCKALKMQGVDMALPYVSCSSNELMEFR